MKSFLKFILATILSERTVENMVTLKKSRFWTNKKIVIENNIIYDKIGSKSVHTFFGYYDISPFNKYRDEIIYLQVKRNDYTSANIVIRDLKKNCSKVIASTNAWNWQQGSRLRWMPNSKNEIVFNDFFDNSFITRIINVETMKERRINSPLYDIHSSGESAITVSFLRLGLMRPGYGYTNKKYIPPNDLCKEGISLIDLTTGNSKLIVSYEDIARVLGSPPDDFGNRYINHLSYSPTSKKFMFLWLNKKDSHHESSLLVYDFECKEIRAIEIKDKVSHYTWINDDLLLCTAYDSLGECYYVKYDTNKCTSEKCWVNDLNLDGHPSKLTNSLFLTDTYPDKNGYQKLIIADMINDSHHSVAEIFSFYSLKSEKRTDLHPRVFKDYVCVDANIRGYRELILFKNLF